MGNSVRTMGEKKAVSIIQVIMAAKAEAHITNMNTIRRYLTPVNVQGINFPLNTVLIFRMHVNITVVNLDCPHHSIANSR